jgi:hypothetical protein
MAMHFGADLGLGVPVVTFPVKLFETECGMASQILFSSKAAWFAARNYRWRLLRRVGHKAATEWKLVPAFEDGRAVAGRLRLAVSAKRYSLTQVEARGFEKPELGFATQQLGPRFCLSRFHSLAQSCIGLR